MPTWKIKGYWFYFKSAEPLKKHKSAHIHVETSRGEIQFWLEPIDVKSEDEIKVKRIKGQVSEPEQSETERIVKKNKDLFLKA